jgi:tRNA-specific 2-thiouridylase
MAVRALALLSGGLDSTLAIRIVQEQGVEVTALNFTSPFCNCTRRDAGCANQAVRVAKELGIQIIVKSKGMDYLRVVEKPPHGYGRQMNPCIDCRIFMLRKARDVMEETGASFIITGEVLGQRPMSQRRDTIHLIERESGLRGRILRPLSAKFFPPTAAEEQGLVDRDKLLRISGRSRKVQLDLARQFHLKGYACPAGGCLLTDPAIARRLRDLFTHHPDYVMKDIHMLRLGRHFRLNQGLKLVVGRDEDENNKLVSFPMEDDLIISPYQFPGPVAVACGKASVPDLELSGGIIAHYGKPGHPEPQVIVTSAHSTERLKVPRILTDAEMESFRI